MLRNVYRSIPILTLAVLLSACAGKEDDKPPRFPTRGMVTYNGQPATGAIVTFWPLPLEKNDWRTVKPMAMVEADGSFQPNSYDLKDGVTKGEYVVTVIWTGKAGGPGPDLLKGRHSDPKNPIAKVTIKTGENVIPPIRLTGPPINPEVGNKGDL